MLAQLQRPELAGPAAEEAAQEQSQDQYGQGRQHQGDDGLGRQHGAGGKQGIEAEEDIDRILQLVRAGIIGLDEQEEKKQQREGLAQAAPGDKAPGSQTFAGAINGEGSLTIEVKGTGKDSFLSQVIDLVTQAQESKSRTQDLANTAAMWLTMVALGGGVITFFIWQVIVGQDFAFAIERTVTVMVIACPHALGLAVPLVVAVSTALAASNGLLIRNRVAFEGARKLQAIIFDKTGTLTEGRFGVTDTLLFSQDIDEDTLTADDPSTSFQRRQPVIHAPNAAFPRRQRYRFPQLLRGGLHPHHTMLGDLKQLQGSRSSADHWKVEQIRRIASPYFASCCARQGQFLMYQ